MTVKNRLSARVRQISRDIANLEIEHLLLQKNKAEYESLQNKNEEKVCCLHNMMINLGSERTGRTVNYDFPCKLVTGGDPDSPECEYCGYDMDDEGYGLNEYAFIAHYEEESRYLEHKLEGIEEELYYIEEELQELKDQKHSVLQDIEKRCALKALPYVGP